MERVSEAFTRYWDGLRARLARELPPLALAFFRELPAADAEAIGGVGVGGLLLGGWLGVAVCDALGGAVAGAVPGAVAIECIHAASLIHDDLVDGDDVRRDAPATWTVQGGRRAVLIGDVMFATALARMAECGNDAGLVLARAIAMVAAGAYREPLDAGQLRAFNAEAAPMRLYERIIRLKTGALFGAAAELGAIAARAAPVHRRAAFDFGACVGEAFQIADDLEDVLTGDMGALSPQQRVTRAILGACFGPRHDAMDAGAAPDAAGTARLAAAMEAAIERRIALAAQIPQRFPATARSRSLRFLPAVVLEPMLADARRPAASPLVNG
jgi:hypothetical protein